MEIKITVTDGRSMRRVLASVVEHCRDERDYCDENGKGSRAECFEHVAVLIEEALASVASAAMPNKEAG